MLTKEEALTADVFHYGNCCRTIGKRGGVKESSTVYRRNGRTQTWKTRPDDYRVPIKRGMREYADITTNRAAEWHTEASCPLRHTDSAVSAVAHVTRIQPVTAPILPGMVFHRLVCTCGHVGKESLRLADIVAEQIAHEREVIATTDGNA